MDLSCKTNPDFWDCFGRENSNQYLNYTRPIYIFVLYFFDYFFFPFQKNPKNLDPSYRMDLDLGDCLGIVKLILLRKFHRTDLIICSLSREGKPCLIAK